jgi:hypothetical protein
MFTDVYRTEPYSHEYHIVTVKYHAHIDAKNKTRHALDSIDTMELVDINEMNTPFTALLRQLINELELREPWRTEINDTIQKIALAETQGELEDVLDSLEERLRDEDVLEYRLFLNAIQKAKEEYNKEEQ